MQETLSPDLVRLAVKSASDEYTDGAVYKMLSRHEKNQSFKKALEDLSRRAIALRVLEGIHAGHRC